MWAVAAATSGWWRRVAAKPWLVVARLWLVAATLWLVVATPPLHRRHSPQG